MSETPRRRAAIRHDTSRLLAGLGDSAEGVAATLTTLGVSGDPGWSNSCPVARYLNAVMGWDQSVGRLQVGVMWVLVHSERRWSPATVVAIPRAVRKFIIAFDSGKYPGLVGDQAKMTRALTGTVAGSKGVTVGAPGDKKAND